MLAQKASHNRPGSAGLARSYAFACAPAMHLDIYLKFVACLMTFNLIHLEVDGSIRLPQPMPNG
jgi:hypothetical protein